LKIIPNNGFYIIFIQVFKGFTSYESKTRTGMKYRILILTMCIFIASGIKLAQAASLNKLRNPDSLEMAKLNKEKLVYEVKKIKEEAIRLKSENKSTFIKIVSDYGSLITTLLAIGGFLYTILTFMSNQKMQKQKDQKQAEKDFILRAEESFNRIIENLGSESESVRASAAVSLMSFLKNEYSFLHDQVYYIYLANLKTKHTETVNKLLVKGFEVAIKIYLDYHKSEKIKLDLSNTNLDRINLSGLDLSDADLGFASLELANLEGTKLRRIRGYKLFLKKAHLSKADLNEARLQEANLTGAQVHDANLVSADMKHSVLQNTEFYNSKLQSAHFEYSNIQGAKFEKAYLADAFFKEVKYTKETLASIKKAFGWEKANYDEKLRAEIRAPGK
jgi:uncharacterized protein YjbI with pentapeptide repeats